MTSISVTIGAVIVVRSIDFLPQANILGDSMPPWLPNLWTEDRCLSKLNSASINAEFGSLTIGFTAAAGYRFLPQLMTAARHRLPGVDLVLKEMVTAGQLEALASRRIDVGLLRPPVRQQFASACVVREPFLAALPAEHP